MFSKICFRKLGQIMCTVKTQKSCSEKNDSLIEAHRAEKGRVRSLRKHLWRMNHELRPITDAGGELRQFARGENICQIRI